MATWFAQRRLRQKVCDLRPQMYRMAFAWCHDAALADDLVQEAMMKALTRLKSLQDENALKAWVFRIMTNCYRDWGRRQKDTVDVDSMELSCEDCPEQQTERNRMVADVHRAMAELSTDHRQVVALVDLEGFAYSEVSEVLDVPIGTVMSRLSRARAQLKKVLLEQQADTGTAADTPYLKVVRNRHVE
ncbi:MULTISPECIES: RNA polymerase sigma factor [Thioalkalivibrio]|uniref:RNA polymerase subunit sigma-24 n=1 Tax=Thioalkalivibrio versutus TaxID=106634 RepID=A0A0G3G4F1_9GAMM|nr:MULTISPECIES: sigma-70 family RNA polymerase sigma factor [Thioalkalivibrio]AKJ96108.1 RNA polymerase subunit sigma-24 [Thioalkalivibrio versutus]